MKKKLRNWYSLEKVAQIFSIALGMSAIVGILLAWQVFGVEHPWSHLTLAGPSQERMYEESNLTKASNKLASYIEDYKQKKIGEHQYLAGASAVQWEDLFKGLIRLEDLPEEFRKKLTEDELAYLIDTQTGYVGYPIAYNEYPNRIPLEVMRELSSQSESDWHFAHEFIQAFKLAEVYVTEAEIRNEGDGASGQIRVAIYTGSDWNLLHKSENLFLSATNLLTASSIPSGQKAFLFIGSKIPLDLPSVVFFDLQDVESEVVNSTVLWIALGSMFVFLMVFISLDIWWAWSNSH